VRVIKGFPLPLAPSRQGREYWMEGLSLEIPEIPRGVYPELSQILGGAHVQREILRGVHPERCVRFFAEFILSAILRSVPSLRMAENEGPRMTVRGRLRMTAATN